MTAKSGAKEEAAPKKPLAISATRSLQVTTVLNVTLRI
jgi:hypothetical protein